MSANQRSWQRKTNGMRSKPRAEIPARKYQLSPCHGGKHSGGRKHGHRRSTVRRRLTVDPPTLRDSIVPERNTVASGSALVNRTLTFLCRGPDAGKAGRVGGSREDRPRRDTTQARPFVEAKQSDGGGEQQPDWRRRSFRECASGRHRVLRPA